MRLRIFSGVYLMTHLIMYLKSQVTYMTFENIFKKKKLTNGTLAFVLIETKHGYMYNGYIHHGCMYHGYMHHGHICVGHTA